MKKTDIVPTDKKIAELNELQNRIDKTTAMIYAAGVVVRDRIREKESLKQRLEVFIQDCKDHRSGIDLSTTKINFNNHYDLSRMDINQRKQYEEINSSLADVEKELLDAKERQRVLQDEEATLLSSMAAMNSNYATECLLYLQKKRNEAEKTVFTINGAITAQQKIIDQENAANQPAIAEATKKREEILADVALGTVDKSELAAIDEQLRKYTDSVSEATGKMNETVTHARQTITGLQRKLESAQREFETAEFARVAAERRFLLAEAEKAGKEYAEAANTIGANFRRLLALNAIMDSKKMQTIECGDFRRILIPLFSLDCHKGHGEREFTAIEKASQFTDIEMDIQSEFGRFAAAGISL